MVTVLISKSLGHRNFQCPGRPQLKQQLAPALFPVFSLAILSGLLCVTAAPGWDAKSFAERRKVVSKRWY
eukprot:206971-Rhodomonas_salina.2